MKVLYNPPSLLNFNEFFKPNLNINGGRIQDINYFKPKYYSRGGSFFSILSSLARTALPFLRNYILPEAGNFTTNLINDSNNNIPLKTNVKKNLMKSVRNIGKRIVRGGGKRKSIKRKKCIKGRKKNDIFDSNPFQHKKLE